MAKDLRDPALATLALPFEQGELAAPSGGRVLFLRARAPLPAALVHGAFERDALVCEQTHRPAVDVLERERLVVDPRAGDAAASFAMTLVLPPRQREESRALLARAVDATADGGLVVASARSDEGARSMQSDLETLLGTVEVRSKHHCRVAWGKVDRSRPEAAALAEWRALDAPREIEAGRFVSRPGVFAWDRVDPASSMLSAALPDDLKGRGADFGCGYGYLACELLAKNAGIAQLDCYDAELRALDLARTNVVHARAAAQRETGVEFFWADVTRGVDARYDFIVTNPPFHQGRDEDPDLGRAFIAAAADALSPGGRLFLVANRHLPYEGVIAERFKTSTVLAEARGYKVVKATRS